MNPTEQNRPLRMLEKALQGGLGVGNLGVLISRHGTGKHAVLTSLAIDRAMRGKNVLHVALNQNVSDVRAYRDEILTNLEDSLDLQDRAEILTTVERHTQIYTYRSDAFNIPKLAQTLDFLADHAQFRPDMIEIQGWPDFHKADANELSTLKRLATAAKCEIWSTMHTQSSDRVDSRGLPEYIARVGDQISVIMSLEPDGDHVPLKFLKVHDAPLPANIRLEFDPTSMLIRWR